jgi:WD40 repeat protein
VNLIRHSVILTCVTTLVLASLLACSAGTPVGAAEDRLGDPLPNNAIQRLGTLRLRYGSIGDLAYLPDGRALIGVGRNLDIWDMPKGEKIETLSVANSSIRRMQLSRDGSRLLMLDGTDIVVYSLTERRELQRLASNQPGINWVTFSPDESRVLSTARTIEPPTLKEFDLATGSETFSQIDGEFAVFICAAYDADGKSAFVGGGFGSSLTRYDLTTGEKSLYLELNNSVNDIALSDDGQRLLLGCRINAVELRTDSCEVLEQFTGHHGHQATAVAYAKDPQELFTGARDGSIRRWDRSRNEVLLRWVPHANRCSVIRVSPDGSHVLSFGGGMVVESDIATGKSTAQWERHGEAVQAVAMMPDGRRVLSASSDTTLRMWDAFTGEPLAIIEGATLGAFCLAISPDGSRAAAGCKDGKIREFSLPVGHMVRELSGHLGYARSVAYTPDGSGLVSSGDDGCIRLWSSGSEELVQVMRGHLGGVLSVAVSQDGQRLLSAGRDGTVRLWSLPDGRLLSTYESHNRWVETVCFTQDGQHGLSAGGDGRIIQWNLASAQIESEMRHDGWIRALVCSPDGQTVAAAGEDNLITCWNLSNGEKTATLRGHAGHVLGLAITPDGSHLVSASADTSLLVWAIPTSK